MHLSIRTPRELFGYITTFQTSNYVKTILPDYSSHLLNSDIGIAPQIRHIAMKP